MGYVSRDTSPIIGPERIHINHVIRDRLKNSIEQSKGKILESITPEEFHLVEKIHENLYKKSFELTKKGHIRKFNELINKNKVTQSPANITEKMKWVINMSSRLDEKKKKEKKRPDDGRSISRNVAHLNILAHDMINLLYYEY